MHLVVGARGIKYHLKMWEEMLSAQYFNHRFKDEKGEIINGAVQLAVRPMMFYELVFPESALDEVLNLINATPKGDAYKGRYKLADAFKYPIRKALKLKPLPKKWDTTKKRAMPALWVSTHPIGIKKDAYNEDGIEQL